MSERTQLSLPEPPDRDWVVTAGLTRRLVSAPTLGTARELFIELAFKGEIPGIRPNVQFQQGELRIREATALEVAEFGPCRRRPKLDGQMQMLLDVPVVKERRRNSGDHA